MATLRDIRRRGTSVSNTMQITNAMKMVATAKLARAQNAVRSAQPYSEVLRDMVTSMSKGMTGDDHPLFQPREEGKSLVIHFTSDRGLCGAFNSNLNKALYSMLNSAGQLPDPELIVFGRVGNDFFRRRNFAISKSVIHANGEEKIEEIGEVIDEITRRFLEGDVARVLLSYNVFKSPLTQHPLVIPLLPIVPPEAGGEEPEPAGENKETLFEPSREGVLNVLLPAYLENQCFQALLNTEAGEHGSRMVSMDGATRNAEEMISKLTLQMNKARQAAITKELIEIVNGAQAL